RRQRRFIEHEHFRIAGDADVNASAARNDTERIESDGDPSRDLHRREIDFVERSVATDDKRATAIDRHRLRRRANIDFADLRARLRVENGDAVRVGIDRDESSAGRERNDTHEQHRRKHSGHVHQTYAALARRATEDYVYLTHQPGGVTMRRVVLVCNVTGIAAPAR